MCNLTALWPKDMGAITSTTKLYFHVKTMSVWGLESAYVTYGPFSVGSLLDNYVSFQWSAYANFKLLVESHFYSESGDPFTYLPGEFVSEGSGLVYIGEKIAAGSIQTHALAVGSGHRNYDVLGLEYHQNNRVKAGDPDGEAAPNNLRITTTTKPWLLLVADASERPNDILRWQITMFNDVPFNTTHPDTIGVSHAFAVLSSTEEPYKVYFKCNKTIEDDAQILITKNTYQPISGDYYYYLAGLYDVREGKASQLALSYGFTFIDGNHITTGIIDCNKVHVHGAGSDVIIDGSGLNIINGKMNFRTGNIHDTSGVEIDSYGIRGGTETSYFRLDKGLGLYLGFGFGENRYIELSDSGISIATTSNTLQATASGITITSANDSVVIDSTGIKSQNFKLTDAEGLVILADSGNVVLNNSGLTLHAGGGTITLDKNGLTGPNFSLTGAGLQITGGDITVSDVNGAGGKVVITPSTFTISSNTGSSGTLRITPEGITHPQFSLTAAGGLVISGGTLPEGDGLTLPFAAGSQTQVTAQGIWTGQSINTNSVLMSGRRILVSSTQQECVMGYLDDGTYGFWAGAASGAHAKLDKTGLKIYGTDGKEIVNTQTNTLNVKTGFATIMGNGGLLGSDIRLVNLTFPKYGTNYYNKFQFYVALCCADQGTDGFYASWVYVTHIDQQAEDVIVTLSVTSTGRTNYTYIATAHKSSAEDGSYPVSAIYTTFGT